MTREEIIRMAREAGLFDYHAHMYEAEIIRFAELVAAAERERCAKACEEAPYLGNDACECADIIRALP